MIQLHQYPCCWDATGISPFCMKLETYMRMAQIPFECHRMAHQTKIPLQKLSYIQDGNIILNDSKVIIKYLKEKYGDPLDEDLNAKQLGTGHALERMLENHLYWAIVYSRWLDPENFKFVKPHFLGFLPRSLQRMLPNIIYRNMKKALHAQGLNIHDPEEIYKVSMQDIYAIESHLQAHQYVISDDSPSSVDATAYAFLCMMLHTPLDCPLHQYAQNSEAIYDYCSHITDRYFKPKSHTLDPVH